MTRRRHALALGLAAALACAAPGAALAQNAGDEQYKDPFGKLQNKQKTGSGTTKQHSSGGRGGTAGQGSSGASQQPSGAQSGSGTRSQSTGAAASQTLPRTGLPAGVLAAAGMALLAGGAVLRRGTAAQR